MRPTARARLIDAGVDTSDTLAAAAVEVEGLSVASLEGLRAQAKLQLGQESSSEPVFEITDAGALAAIPPPDPGDLFFDFEGDPPEWRRGSRRS